MNRNNPKEMDKDITVVKIGGALVSDALAIEAFWDGVRFLQKKSKIIVVHGGGPQATSMAHRLGHTPRIINGRRITTELDLEIIHWTLRGQLNIQLVRTAQKAGLMALGLSGADAGIVQVAKRPPWQIDDEEVDFGWVGDITGVNPRILHVLLDTGYLPVIATLGIDKNCHTFNVNGDTVACAIAEAVQASRFIMVTEAGGVRRKADDPTTQVKSISKPDCKRGGQEGWITDGMIVKLDVGFDALNRGIQDVFVSSPFHLDDSSKGTRLIP